MAWFIGVDQGSHSSRAVLFNESGELVSKASQPVSLNSNHNHAEYEAQLLLDSVSLVLRQLLSSLDTSQINSIQACGIATQRSTALAWNDSGQALSPALSWQDTRASAQIELLASRATDIQRITGLPLAPYYSASKMRWLLEHDDEVIDHAENHLRLSPLASYLLFNLLEERPYVIDYSNAQRTQLFDLSRLEWSESLCGLFGVGRQYLPQCQPMRSHYGRLSETGIPVTAVCGDQNAAIYGLGSLDADTALVNIGSGAFILRMLSDFKASNTQLTGLAYADNDRVQYMREATVNGAGNALTWAREVLGIDHSPELLARWLEEIPSPPVFINSIGGLGTPWMRDDIEPSFSGETDYSDAEKCVAILESIVFLIQMNLDLMLEESSLSMLRVSGGLSNLDGLCQKLSDLSGFRLERAETAEATARGVAWLAAGCPQAWSDSTAIDVFTPCKDEDLEYRYAMFKQQLNDLLESVM